MKSFDVQGIQLQTNEQRAFAYIANTENLPHWTNAFASIAGDKAMMRTPAGEVEIALSVEASPTQGTIDWYMTFPDGSLATAFSRLVKLSEEQCAYTFVLTPPPGPLEALEGALEAQSQTLSQELQHLKRILEQHG